MKIRISTPPPPPPPRRALGREHRHSSALAAMALMAWGLAGCGGGDSAPNAVDSKVPDPPTRITATLLDDAGLPTSALAEAVPVDRGAHTRSGLYALREQAMALERALPGDTIWVPVGCCGAEAAELAVQTAAGLQAAGDLPQAAPVFVAGNDLRLAAAVVARLSDAGMTRVFLVTD